jgi:hypothetical protein
MKTVSPIENEVETTQLTTTEKPPSNRQPLALVVVNKMSAVKKLDAPRQPVLDDPQPFGAYTRKVEKQILQAKHLAAKHGLDANAVLQAIALAAHADDLSCYVTELNLN